MELTEREGPGGIKRRTVLAGLASLAAFGSIGYRLYRLQVAEAEHWASRSERNRIRLQRIPPTRGRILDARGEPLVENRPAFDLVVVPEDAADLAATLERARALLGIELPPAEEILAAARRRPSYEGIVVRRDLPRRAVVRLETRQLDLPGLRLEVGPLRTYPLGPVAAHLLGYVGEVSDAEMAADPRYRPGDRIGKFGAERAFEGTLRGEPGGRQIEVDAAGRRLRVLSEVDERPGASLVLTIDRRLQQFAEQLMDDREGAIVALDPASGAIRALVSRPAFDPNVFARGISGAAWRELAEGPLGRLTDRAIQGQYPPGSTFKIVTAAAALEEGVVTPFTRIFCGGSYRFGRRRYRCWKRGGHGFMNLHDALVQSCDVYFYQAGQRLGVDAIAEYAHRLGLGETTGIRLDGEKPGLIPTRAWKQRRFREPWFAGETLSVAIGQGYVLATPLQMAHLIATVANGGTRYRPRYVDRVVADGGRAIEEFPPEERGRAGLRPSTLHQIRTALRDVVNAPHGTGRRARLRAVDIAGKTGTAQVYRMGRRPAHGEKIARSLRDHAWFVAFAPVEQPEIAIAVLLEHAGGGGGHLAAPLARDLADFHFGLTRGRDYPLRGGTAPVA